MKYICLLVLIFFVASCTLTSPGKAKSYKSKVSPYPRVEIIRGNSFDVLELLFDKRPKIRTIIPYQGSTVLWAGKKTCRLMLADSMKLIFTYDPPAWEVRKKGKISYKK